MPNNFTLPVLVAEKAKTDPDFQVLTFEDNGIEETRTYRELWENSLRIALALRDRGIKDGDRFAILMQNHPEFVEFMIAAGILGAITVPIDPRTKGEKLSFMLRDSGCVGVVCGSYALDNLIQSVNSYPSLKWIYVTENTDHIELKDIYIDHTKNINNLPVIEIPILSTELNNPMQIMYTSGTTGDPKGILIPHGRFVQVAKAGELVFGYRTDDRPYTGLSLTHGNAQFISLAPSLLMGLHAVFSRKFTKSRLWNVIKKYQCTTFSLLGGMATAIYSEPIKSDDSDNPVRFVVSAGMPKVIWEEFAKRYNVQIFEFYGAMEGGMTINPPGEGPAGSCGRVAPGLIAKVVDDDGNEVAPNTLGEIWFRSADGTDAIVSYHNNPKASAEKTVGGWLHTGDAVIMDENGWIYFQHRLGGEIRKNGDFINPAFLEKIISEHPDVSDVTVFGVPSSSGAPGEMDVTAAIIPTNYSEFRSSSIFSWCRQKAESNMIPTYLMVLDEFPRTASEKVQTRFIKKMFTNKECPIYNEQGIVIS